MPSVRLVVFAALAVTGPAFASFPADFVVDTTMDGADMAPGDGVCADMTGACTLRAAVQESNAEGGSHVISLQPGLTYTLEIGGAGEDMGMTGDLDVTSMIRVQGAGAVVDAAGLDRAFDVFVGGSLWLQDLQISNGYVFAESGGGVRNAGDLRAIDLDVLGCAALGAGASGGAVMNDRGYVHLVRAELVGNMAERAGGAIEANEGSTVIGGSVIDANMTGPGPGNGGGLHLTGRGAVVITDTIVSGNTASREGGGLWNSSTGTMAVEDCDVSGNVALGVAADDGGGGLFNDGGTLTVSGSTITGNTAVQGSGSGGGVLNLNGDLTILRSTIDGNTASRAGGGVEASVGTTVILESFLTGNSTGPTPGNGGGFHLTGAGTVFLEGVRVLDNVASAEGGGVWNSSTGMMSVSRCYVARNVASGAAADQGGGGVFSDGGVTVIDGSVITQNRADGAAGSGGGVLNNLGAVEIYNTEISQNSAVRAGGGVEANIGRTLLDGVRLLANTTGAAPGNGGGLHLTGAGVVDVTGGRVESNSATAEGGGLWNSSTGVMTVNGTIVRRNVAPVNPQGHNDGGVFTVNGMMVPVTP